MSDVDFGRAMGASCALHPGREATGTCERCGNFMCDTCSQDGASPRCPTCRERSGATFPLNRETWNFNALWDVCWAAFQREWGMLSLAVLITLGVTLGANLLFNVATGIGAALDSVAIAGVLALLGLVAQQLVQGLVQLGLMRVCFDVLHGGRVDVARLFSQMHKAVPYALTMLLLFVIVLVPVVLLLFLGILALVGTGLLSGVDLNSSSDEFWNALVPFFGLMGLGFAVLVVPITYLVLPLYLVQPELAYDDAPPSPWEVLRRSWVAARGQRLSMLGVSLMAGLAMVAGVFACCVGFIPGMALAQLLIAGMYLSVRLPRDAAAESFPG
ncbi:MULTISPECIES: hypothetical protein [unclassified Corallococcus]|uniref:hypothetical protein n=1 Tax=unclassified Corallococcus TaxID=2685029 RepID=UPI001A8C93B0|nr:MULTISPECIES: hypothetical protein [unclassified Corallococcus]MBN9681876.1 hypothetical protein [Corallococcus sp. NCSPR001]WAS86556.1 hypothetical protein O0N60_06165 [Corallococcus sp. NCRR]